MIRHLVMWKLKDFAEGQPRKKNALILKQKLEALKELIPQIKRLEVGINHPQAIIENFDLVLDSEFESLEDLHIYKVHPEHLKVAEFVSKIRLDRSAVDYEFSA